MRELRCLGAEEQIKILGVLGDLRLEQFYDSSDPDRFGKFSRGGKTFYRARIGDLRFYFEFTIDGIHCHYILQKNTFDDFCFRCGFSSPEKGSVEQKQQFWEFLTKSSQDQRENTDDSAS